MLTTNTIKWKLSIGMIIPLIIVFSLGIAGLLLYQSTSTKKLNESVFSSLIVFNTKYIEDWLNQQSLFVDRYSKLPDNKKYGVESLSDIKLSGIITNITGTLTTYYGRESDGLIFAMIDNLEEIIASGYDSRKRNWYINAAKDRDRMIISDPYEDAFTKKIVITVSRTAPGGVAAADIAIDDVSNFVKNLNVPGNGFAILTYGKENNILAYKDTNYLQKPLTDLDPGLNAAAIKKVIENTQKGESTELQIKDMGTKLIGGSSIKGTDWNIFIVIDKDYFYGDMVKLFTFFILLTLLITVASYLLIQYYANQSIVKPIAAVNKHLHDLADGRINLNTPIKVETGDELEDMADSLNRFLDSQYGNILRISSQLEQSVAKSYDNKQLIEESIYAQKNIFNTFISLIGRMKDLSAGIIDRSDDTVGRMQNISDKSKEGMELLSDTNESMSSLSESIASTKEAVTGVAQYSEEIAVLSETIKTIADQTNLLALNAAIESARAGEHGRGFAVVADEVRNLAVKTRESTEKIQSTVEALTNSMHSTIRKVEQSTEDFHRTMEYNNKQMTFLKGMVDDILQTTEHTQEITTNAREQSEMLVSVNQEMTNIDNSQKDIDRVLRILSDDSAEMKSSTENIISELLQNSGSSQV